MAGAGAVEIGIVAEAYEELAAGPGEFISIRALREVIGGRVADLDRTLVGMYREGLINLTPQENQFALTPADRDAAVKCGGEEKHRMSWED
jgi:hypothetical protein